MTPPRTTLLGLALLSSKVVLGQDFNSTGSLTPGNSTFTFADATKPFYLQAVLDDNVHTVNLITDKPGTDGHFGLYGHPFFAASNYKPAARFVAEAVNRSATVSGALELDITYHDADGDSSKLIPRSFYLDVSKRPVTISAQNISAHYAVLGDKEQQKWVVDSAGFIYASAAHVKDKIGGWWLVRVPYPTGPTHATFEEPPYDPQNFNYTGGGRNVTVDVNSLPKCNNRHIGALVIAPDGLENNNSSMAYISRVRLRAVPVSQVTLPDATRVLLEQWTSD